MLSVVVTGTVVAAAYAVYTPLRGGASAHYDVTWMATVLVFAAAALGAVGILAVWGRPDTAAASSAIAIVCCTVGALTLFSLIGLPILAVGLVALASTVRTLPDRRRTYRLSSSLGGAAIGGALLAIGLIFTRPPTVVCAPNGAGAYFNTGTRVTTTVSADGKTTTGEIRSENAIETFVCEEGRLIEFRQQGP